MIDQCHFPSCCHVHYCFNYRHSYNGLYKSHLIQFWLDTCICESASVQLSQIKRIESSSYRESISHRWLRWAAMFELFSNDLLHCSGYSSASHSKWFRWPFFFYFDWIQFKAASAGQKDVHDQQCPIYSLNLTVVNSRGFKEACPTQLFSFPFFPKRY